MQRLIGIGLCVSASFLPLGLHAAASGQQPAVKADPAALGIDDTKIICKRWQESGSRIPTKKCATNRQWKLMEEMHKRGARDMIERPIINTNRG